MLVGLTLVLSACDVLGTSSSDSIQVQLNEWALTADPGTTVAGTNTFEVTNNGKETHSFAVLLPSEVNEDRFVVVGELGELKPEETRTLTVTLAESTTYQLASMRVTIQAGKLVSDYDKGMQLDYDVE